MALGSAVPERGAPFVSVVIPARNEGLHIAGAMRAVYSVLAAAGYRHEIVVVDDGSTDGTADEVRRAAGALACRLICHPRPTGKGGAVASGFKESTGEFVAFIDADLEFAPDALIPMLRAVLSAPDPLRACAIASRVVDRRRPSESFSSKLARFAVHVFLGLKESDTQAGLKLFPGWFARKFLSTPEETGWLFDIEALLLASDYGLAVAEVPIVQHQVRPRRAGGRDLAACALRLAAMAFRRWRRSLPAAGHGRAARDGTGVLRA